MTNMNQIETLPTRSQDVQPLQNVLSISTAGKNRYLLHFNSLHSLTQWTAGIRLAMFEHATLQEAYTGSLIAGKGKTLNNIRVIMERTKFKSEDWARVRFGAGTPWRRCWCVITPPDEKEVHKQQKSLKKKSAYDRSAPILKGDVKFYDTKKTKKAIPIATIRDAYSAYAIYPQSKPLIDQSTLVKVEGTITIHSTPETTQEGFVFVMPEVHPAVTGFEMMLRWLFPLYDVFAMYGRPTRLIADTLDVRSLMFALPQEKRYGYLEILDVAGLIHEPGSQTWREKEWRQKLKEVTSTRVSKMQSNGGRSRSRASSYRGHRNSLPSRAGTLRYEDGASVRSSPSVRDEFAPSPPPHTGSAPPGDGPFRPPKAVRTNSHQRSVSEASPYGTPRHQKLLQRAQDDQDNYTPSRLSYEANPSDPNVPLEPVPPVPPAHAIPYNAGMRNPQVSRYATGIDSPNRSSSESERRMRNGADAEAQEIQHDVRPMSPPAPVAAPPAFVHEPGVRPPKRPGVSPEMRRANSRLSITTLSQLADSGRLSTGEAVAAAGAAAAWRSRSNTTHGDGRSPEPPLHNGYADSPQRNGSYTEDRGQRGVIDDSSRPSTTADHSGSEGLFLGEAVSHASSYQQPSGSSTNIREHHFQPRPVHQEQSPQARGGLHAPASSTPRSVSPLSQSSTHGPSPLQQPKEETLPSRTFSGNEISQAEYPHVVGAAHPPIRAPTTPTERRPDMSRVNTSRSITRKPVPDRRSQSQAFELPAPALAPANKTSLESLRQHVVDEEALNQIGAHHGSRTNTMDSYARRPSDAGSIYDDDDSTASPDYASTRRSTETKRSRPSVDKPRAGKLKTVGTVEPVQKEVVVGDEHYRPDAPLQEINPDIPTVDFGPTQVYDPKSTSRPNTSGTLTQQVHDRPGSSGRLTPRNESPNPGIIQDTVNVASGGRPNEPYDRAPSRNMTTPEFERRAPSAEPDQDRRRSVAWQPGAAVGGGSPGNRQSITPEQFVQQRAAANRVIPVYAHTRKASGSHTPPLPSRNASGEVPSQQHLRSTSYARELQASPRPRNAPSPTNFQGDYTANLSAREQEHVARATGSPLINVAANPKRQAPQPSGLIGAIEAREQEKKDIRQGYSNTAVQHAIAQRQQHSQAHPSRQQSYNTPTPQMNIPGQWPQTPTQYASTPGQFSQTPGQFSQTPNYAQSQYGYGMQQQYQSQGYDQYPQQQPQPHWTPPAGLQHVNTQQYSQQPQQYQQTAFQQQQALRQGYYQNHQAQGQQQPQQQYYGPYFGNGQGQQR